MTPSRKLDTTSGASNGFFYGITPATFIANLLSIDSQRCILKTLNAAQV
jgi:hypothetical protein